MQIHETWTRSSSPPSWLLYYTLMSQTVKSLPLTTLDTSCKITPIIREMGHQWVSVEGAAGLASVGLQLARIDNPLSPAPRLLSQWQLNQDRDRWAAAVCYSTLHSGEGGNVQIGFRTLHEHHGSRPEAPRQVQYGFQWKNSRSCGLDIYQGVTELQKNP